MASASDPAVLIQLPKGDDDQAVAFGPGVRVVRAETSSRLLERLTAEAWSAVVLTVSDEADLHLLTRIAAAAPSAVLVALHPAPTVDTILDAEAAGASFLLRFPDELERIPALLHPYLQEHADHEIGEAADDEDRVVGTSAALTEAYRTIARVAGSSAPVLIEGESGTGKELVARALHLRSPRARKEFVAVNCAALPEGLLEAELFGYERGAFTGAVGRSAGRFGRADGGTLFLDEIGEMGPGAQAKLLRALENGEIERLGSAETVRVDARVVAATNRNLEQRVAEGAFREDLLYRLAVVRVTLPPLRDRMDDLLPLVKAFVARFAARYGRRVHGLSEQAARALQARAWPGNVRELRNVLDRAVLLARGGVVRSVDLAADGAAPSLAPLESAADGGFPPTLSLKEVEERHIRRVLARTDGHLGEAAEILGVHRNTMTAKVREHGIDPRAPFAPDPGASRE